MSFFSKKWLSWIPVILWAGLIFYLSSLPTLPSAQRIWWDYLAKKTAHIFVYATLYYFTYQALKHHTNRPLRWAFILTLAYAISDEIHQSFTPGRHPGLYDVYYDTLGMGIVYSRLRRWI